MNLLQHHKSLSGHCSGANSPKFESSDMAICLEMSQFLKIRNCKLQFIKPFSEIRNCELGSNYFFMLFVIQLASILVPVDGKFPKIADVSELRFIRKWNRVISRFVQSLFLIENLSNASPDGGAAQDVDDGDGDGDPAAPRRRPPARLQPAQLPLRLRRAHLLPGRRGRLPRRRRRRHRRRWKRRGL